jgi:hypothetical protein
MSIFQKVMSIIVTRQGEMVMIEAYKRTNDGPQEWAAIKIAAEDVPWLVESLSAASAEAEAAGKAPGKEQP